MLSEISPENVEEYLEQHQKKELLRFVAVGSVDDGKSTLIGRLLHDTQGVYEDQLSAVRRASKQAGGEIDFSLFTDGLKAEREQGITIDVAYRYFSTAKRKFIIADTPGHIQYTRNMATGASTANVAIILIDARLGVLQQSRRHAYIASLLGIPHLAVAINKMDLMDYQEQVFREIVRAFGDFAKPLGFKDISFIPISALAGDNVVSKTSTMPWWQGGTMLEYLETVPISNDRNLNNFRYPVQIVLRPDLHYRGFAGEITSGVVNKGDPILVLPSRKQTRVAAIDTFDGELSTAHAPMNVTLRLADEIDISRGDMLVHPDDVPQVARAFEAMIVWMNERELDTQKSYLLKHTTQLMRAQVKSVTAMVDLETLKEVPAATLGLNDIGRVRIEARRALHFDPYVHNRGTGSFILIDSLSNNTVAAGMIVAGAEGSAAAVEERAGSQVSARERRERLGQSGIAVALIGEVAKGRDLAYALERSLFDAGHVSVVFDFSQHTPEQGRAIADATVRAGLICIAVAPSQELTQALLQSFGKPGLLGVGEGSDAAQGAVQLDVQLGREEPVERAAQQVIQALEQRGLFENS